PERPDRRRHLRAGARTLAAERRGPDRVPRPHRGDPVSTTVVNPVPAARPRGADPAGPLPVLAVDLVTDPSLPGGLAELARGLEEAGAGALTLSDGGLHPIHVAAHLAPLTSTIGLLPRTDAIYVEPFHLATQLMSLDHISHGRAGWLLQAETDPAVAAAVGRTVLGLEATAREAADVLVAARRVWDSWAPDAVVRDTERGVYVDAARLQYTDIETETFSVRGPAITPRSPQGLLPALVADTDRAAVGERVRGELADGRVLDLDVSGGARAKQLAARIEAARADGVGRAAAVGATTDGADGADGADRADGAAAVGADGAATGTAGTVRLVRLVGLDLEADPLGTV